LSDKNRNDLIQTPNFVNVVNIAFAIPDGTGSIDWLHDGNQNQIIQIIEGLQKKNKLVLISIGGADAPLWNLKSINMDVFATNIKNFVDRYRLNGIDIDYELIENKEQLSNLIVALRKIMPKDKYYVTYTASAIGAYGIPNHEHNEWNDYPEKGIDIPILTEVEEQLDWVNVMAYNAFNSNITPLYDPRSALLAFKDLLKGKKDKIVLGIHLGKQDWPANTIITSKMICPSIEFVKNQKYKGIMFWTLKKDIYNETGEPTGTFSNLIRKCLDK
jgi:chitinase